MEAYILALYVTFMNIVQYRQSIGRKLTLEEKAKMIQFIFMIVQQCHEQCELEHRVARLVQETKSLVHV